MQVFLETTSQRDYKTTSQRDHKWAVAGCFKTTRPRLYKTTSKVVDVLPFDFRLLSFTLCLSTIKKTENSTLLARPHPCISRIPYKGDTDVIYLGVVGPLGFQRRRRFSESISLQDNKWAIAGLLSVVLKKNVLRRLTMKSTRSLVDLLS